MHRKWWTLFAVSVATFMLLLDITVVNTALPSIHDDLGASFTDLQWVIDAYTLSLAALVLTAGVLADRLGRRRVFAAGLAIFTVASLAAGLAPDPTFLNVARAIQGIGGAIMFAVSLALVAQEFAPGRERGTAMGIYGATIGVSVAIGPLVGGALVDSPLEAGLIYLPFTVVNFFGAAAGGALLARLPARAIMSVGLLITGVALLLMGGLDPTDDWTAMLGGFILGGVGTGLLNPVIADVAVSVVPKEQSGMAAGINDTFRQVGIAVGIAAWGAIFLGRGAEKVEQVAAGTPAATGERPRQLIEAVSSGNLDTAVASVPPGAREGVAGAAREGFLSGLNEILLLGGILSFAAAMVALWLVRERDIDREPAEIEAPHL